MKKALQKFVGIILFLFLFSALSCNSKNIENFYLGKSPSDFENENLTLTPKDWEDGLRTSMDPGSFEWWYFDSLSNDGTYIAIIFFKALTNLSSDPVPFVSIRIRNPDGSKIEIEESGDVNISSFAKNNLDIRIGDNFVKGDLKNITLNIKIKKHNVNGELKLNSISTPWRPGTGKWYFGDKKDKYFSWFVAIPKGQMNGELSVDGRKITFHNSEAYHDHNWGNDEMHNFWDNWWWSRSDFDQYSVLTAVLKTTKKYGQKDFPLFLLMEDGKNIFDDENLVSFKKDAEIIHNVSKKKLFSKLSLNFSSHKLSGIYEFKINDDNVVFDLLELQPIWKKLIAKLLGISPWYYRFTVQSEFSLFLDNQIMLNQKKLSVAEFMQLSD